MERPRGFGELATDSSYFPVCPRTHAHVYHIDSNTHTPHIHILVYVYVRKEINTHTHVYIYMHPHIYGPPARLQLLLNFLRWQWIYIYNTRVWRHTHTYPYVSIHTHTHFDLLALIFDCWKETQNGTSVTQNWNCPRSRTERTWPLAKRSPLMCWNSSRQCYIVLDLLNSFYVSDSPIGSLIYHNLPFGEPTLNIRVYIYTHCNTLYIHTLYIYYYKIVFL